jgi:hypothetical protein
MTGSQGATPATGFANQHQQQDIRKVVGTQTYDRSLESLQKEFAHVDPDSIDRACRAWQRMSSELFTLAEDIKARVATPLDQAWSGPTSPQAQNQLRMAEATTRELANQCARMASATDEAARYARQYKNSQPSTGEVYAGNALGAAKRAAVPLAIGGAVLGAGMAIAQVATGDAEGTDKAVKHMQELLAHYSRVTSTLPDNVQTTLAQNDDVRVCKVNGVNDLG